MYNIQSEQTEEYEIKHPTPHIKERRKMKNVAIGLLIPFLGTTLGSTMVFFMKKQVNRKIERLLLGFAAGVMIYVVVEELIPEAQE